MKIDDSELPALGASLRPINADWMKPAETDADQKRLWYQGHEPYFDVLVELSGADLTWCQVTLRGKVLSWRSPHSLQTGETDELDVPPEVAYYAASKTIRDGSAVDWHFVQQVQTILAQQTDDPVLAEVSHLLKAELEERSR